MEWIAWQNNGNVQVQARVVLIDGKPSKRIRFYQIVNEKEKFIRYGELNKDEINFPPDIFDLEKGLKIRTSI